MVPNGTVPRASGPMPYQALESSRNRFHQSYLWGSEAEVTNAAPR